MPTVSVLIAVGFVTPVRLDSNQLILRGNTNADT
jgi:hypothetical protein